MLRNLAAIAGGDADPNAVLRYLNAILAIEPEDVFTRMQRAYAHARRGAMAKARSDFEWILDHRPAGIDLDRVRRVYESLE